MKKCLTSLVITGVHVKTTVRYYCPPPRMFRIKKKNENIASIGHDVKELESSYTASGNVVGYGASENWNIFR